MDYTTVFEQSEASIEIKRSEFIAQIFHAESPEEADEFIEAVRKKHYRARHNCYAYVMGDSADIKKASDDGEPASTAGRPILSVIENNGLNDVLIIVTRYFGGIKLGASGLTRAYASAASEAVKGAAKVEMKTCAVTDIAYDYSLHGKVDAYLRNSGVRTDQPEFSDRVGQRIYIPVGDEQIVRDELISLTNARIEMTRACTEHVRYSKGE